VNRVLFYVLWLYFIFIQLFEMALMFEELGNALSQVLNQSISVNSVCKMIKEILKNVHHISDRQAVAIAKDIFFPFVTPILTKTSDKLAMKMVQLLVWWIHAKPEKVTSMSVLQHVRERMINRRKSTNTDDIILTHLFRLFSMKPCCGCEIDALVDLLTECLTEDMSKKVVFVESSEEFLPVWYLYFNPLTIRAVIDSRNEKDKACAVGKSSYDAQEAIYVRWSDGREDRYENGIVCSRRRVFSLVHLCLNSCRNSEEISFLLQPLLSQPSLYFETRSFLNECLRLLTHLISLPSFNSEMMCVVFDLIRQNVAVEVKNEIYFHFLSNSLNLFQNVITTVTAADLLAPSLSEFIISTLCQFLLSKDETERKKVTARTIQQIC
jgi:hypothetical protein